MIRLPNRQFWVSTNNGITKLGAAEPALASETSYVVQASHDGRPWLASFKAEVTRFDPARGAIERFPLPARVMSAVVDHGNQLWVGTTAGLFRVADADAPARDIHPVPVLPGGYGVCDDGPRRDGVGAVLGQRASARPRRPFRPRRAPGRPEGHAEHPGIHHRGRAVRGHVIERVQRFRVAGGHVEQSASITAPAIGSNYIVAERRDHRGWMWLGTDRGLDMFDGRIWRHFERSDGLISTI